MCSPPSAGPSQHMHRALLVVVSTLAAAVIGGPAGEHCEALAVGFGPHQLACVPLAGVGSQSVASLAFPVVQHAAAPAFGRAEDVTSLRDDCLP